MKKNFTFYPWPPFSSSQNIFCLQSSAKNLPLESEHSNILHLKQIYYFYLMFKSPPVKKEVDSNPLEAINTECCTC